LVQFVKVIGFYLSFGQLHHTSNALSIVKEDYQKWYSPTLGRDIEMLTYGHWGYPILLFPTSMGTFYQNRDMGLTNSVKWYVETGKIKLYCIDGIDKDSWYAKHLHPAMRVHNHATYDRFLNDELVQTIRHECNVDKIAVAGCSFGGYHAMNFAMKHPDKVAYMFSMSGAFDIRSFLDGYNNDTVYFNNPIDFMQNEAAWKYGHMKIVLGTSEWDICLNDNVKMSNILKAKGINHWLDVRGWENHDWPLWNKMLPDYVSKMGL
jgi:esterase/lipase superfamily enzyme